MPRSRRFGLELGFFAVFLVVVAVVVQMAFSSGGGSSGGANREEAAAVVASPTPAAPGIPPTPSPEPTPVDDGCGPPVDSQFMADNIVLTYYGNPYSDLMGILGEMPPADLVARLRGHAAVYDALTPRDIAPGFHIVHGTAQYHPGPDGLYLMYIDDETLSEYVDLACEEDLLVFLDMQIGWSDVESEVMKMLPWLEQTHVHLALDPEFAMEEGQIPGDVYIGTMDATEVNRAQEILSEFVQEHNLPDKILVVHKFVDKMITRPELLEEYPGVHLVIDMDGFGGPEAKRVKYDLYARPAPYAGIKLFFLYDEPLMTEEEVLELEPDLIIYQ
jgi:hypothetical protein